MIGFPGHSRVIGYRSERHWLGRSLALVIVASHVAGCANTDTLENEAKVLNLSGGVVVYGVYGKSPDVIRLGGEPDEKYPLWSLSKPITAAVVEQMAVSDPELMQSQTRGASMEQLLQHTGGWDRSETDDPISLESDNCTKPPEVPRLYPAGARQIYSNFGYCLIADVLHQRSGESYLRLAHYYVPQTRNMDLDPRLGAAGGWSGTALDYWSFAVKPISAEALRRHASVPSGPYYGYSWRVDGTTLSHFGMIYGRSFTLVVKQGDFAAVALFRSAPADPYVARDRLIPLLLELRNQAGQ